MGFLTITGSPFERGTGERFGVIPRSLASPFLSRTPHSVKRPQIPLRQPNLIALSRPPDVAGHAVVVDLLLASFFCCYKLISNQ